MRQGERSGQLLQGLIAVLVLGGGALTLWNTAFRPAGAKTLAVHLGTVRSSVTEALLLLQQARAGRLTDSYFRTEMELLNRDVDKAATTLASADPEPDLRFAYEAGAQLASRAASSLRTIARPNAPIDSIRPAAATLFEVRAFVDALAEAEKP